ncbi:MAG: acyl carrier protein [Alphaproteobacteria bacterium]|nr:acyl carrier protein [Alphaproteobacteria bacterium]
MNSCCPGNNATLIAFINSNYRPVVPIESDTELVRNEIVDSYSILELITFIEGNFDLNIPDEDIRPDNFRTVDAMCVMVERLRVGNDAT